MMTGCRHPVPVNSESTDVQTVFDRRVAGRSGKQTEVFLCGLLDDAVRTNTQNNWRRALCRMTAFGL
jgi:hypothetical protein